MADGAIKRDTYGGKQKRLRRFFEPLSKKRLAVARSKMDALIKAETGFVPK